MTSTLGACLVTFGSDAAIEAVLSRVADSAEEFPVWGTLSEGDAAMFRWATEGLGALPVFQAGPFRLEQEHAAQVFEALCDYATGETPCDPDASRHRVVAKSGVTTWCDCELRDRAGSWAGDVAVTFQVEMV